MVLLEFIGMITSILGAIFLSLSERKYRYKNLIAFNLFFISNFVLIIFSAYKGLVFLFIQMIFFIYSSYFVLKAKYSDYAEEKYKFIYYKEKFLKKVELTYKVLLIVSIFIGILIFDYNSNENFGIIDIMAAFLAVIGSFIMKFKSHIIHIIAFILFIIADILYVYIAIEHNLIYFAIQSLFFTLTSSYGIYNVLNDKKIKNKELCYE